MRFFIVTVSPFNKKFFDALSEGYVIPFRKELLLTIYPFGKWLSRRKWMICKIFLSGQQKNKAYATSIRLLFGGLPCPPDYSDGSEFSGASSAARASRSFETAL